MLVSGVVFDNILAVEGLYHTTLVGLRWRREGCGQRMRVWFGHRALWGEDEDIDLDGGAGVCSAFMGGGLRG